MGRHSEWNKPDPGLKQHWGRSPGIGVWDRYDSTDLWGLGRKPPTHGNIGPAKRGFRCEGEECWDPNRFGWCRTCGGDAPELVAETECV